jgi:hypothetical protein
VTPRTNLVLIPYFTHERIASIAEEIGKLMV